MITVQGKYITINRMDELTDMAAQVGLEVPSSAYWKRTVNYRKHEGVMA